MTPFRPVRLIHSWSTSNEPAQAGRGDADGTTQEQFQAPEHKPGGVQGRRDRSLRQEELRDEAPEDDGQGDQAEVAGPEAVGLTVGRPMALRAKGHEREEAKAQQTEARRWGVLSIQVAIQQGGQLPLGSDRPLRHRPVREEAPPHHRRGDPEDLR